MFQTIILGIYVSFQGRNVATCLVDYIYVQPPKSRVQLNSKGANCRRHIFEGLLVGHQCAE